MRWRNHISGRRLQRITISGKIAALVKTRIEIFPDINDQIDFIEELPDYDCELYRHKKMKNGSGKRSGSSGRSAPPFWKLRRITAMMRCSRCSKDIAGEKGYKIGYVMWPLRTAVSGKQSTPGGATELMEVFGKEESLRQESAEG